MASQSSVEITRVFEPNYTVGKGGGARYANYRLEDYNDNFNDALQAALDQVELDGSGNITVLFSKDSYEIKKASRIFISPNTYIDFSNNTLTMEANTVNGQNGVGFQKKGNLPINNVTLTRLHLDGNKDNQVAENAGGVGLNFTDVNNLILDKVRVENFMRFNAFVGIGSGTSMTGTATFVVNSKRLVGVGTLFTTEIQPGQRIRDNAGQLSFPVKRIISDTELDFEENWVNENNTSSEISAVDPVLGLKVLDSYFGANERADSFGGGGYDYPKFSNCEFFGTNTYGLGATSVFGGEFINCTASFCGNGFGGERLARCTFTNCIAHDCVAPTVGGGGSGFQLGNGNIHNTLINCHAYSNNLIGFFCSNFISNEKGVNYGNKFLGCKSFENGQHGFYDAAHNSTYENCEAFNNAQVTSGFGFVLRNNNAYGCESPKLIKCRAYDDQTILTQGTEVYIDSSVKDAYIDMTFLSPTRFLYEDLFEYSDTKTYNIGDFVIDGANYYRANANTALAESPTSTPATWDQIITWNAGTTYSKDDFVIYNGYIWLAKVGLPLRTDNLNKIPDLQANGGFWARIIPTQKSENIRYVEPSKIRITAGTRRQLLPAEIVLTCNKDIFDWLLPDPDNLADDHTISILNQYELGDATYNFTTVNANLLKADDATVVESSKTIVVPRGVTIILRLDKPSRRWYIATY